MHGFNRGQLLGYDARMVALWKTNWVLIDTLKTIQGSLSTDDLQQRAIFDRIEKALERI
ncbi:hypothetical protein [Paraburkholderia sp. BR10954]|uniref:hypothetical protein n=1 Tax=Paraburkholderia sp. BR10954 TaxID=3236995 RepID=UPI0034D1971A